EPVTAADVRHTLNLLRRPRRAGPDAQLTDPKLNRAGRGSELTDLLEAEPVVRDPFHISLTLRQGFIDPLAAMTFKVLPASLNDRYDPEFARHPVGSGPYLYKGIHTDAYGAFARFVANPNYRRASKVGLPRIMEVHFYHSKDPARDFGRRLHLLLDLPTDKIKTVQTVDHVKVHTLPNRRV